MELFKLLGDALTLPFRSNQATNENFVISVCYILKSKSFFFIVNYLLSIFAICFDTFDVYQI